VATISVANRASGYEVRVDGKLRAADLKRFEHACGPALEHKKLDLIIVLSEPSAMDAAAGAYLTRLEARGAVIVQRRG
jgi:hypothetical protein